jgi:hypothetical protein
LGGGAIKATEKQGEQHDGAGQVNNPHVDPLGLRESFGDATC